MNYRTFGRTGWQVSDVGYGMWGMAAWSGSDDAESLASLQRAVELGCNFFDTAWAYGSGHSERLLGQLVRQNPGVRLYTATKVPPKNGRWPPQATDSLDDVFPPEHVHEYARRSLANLGLEQVDLLQFHVWSDAWADDERWQRAAETLKANGLIGAFGLSLNRWMPENGLRAIRTGAVDAVQVVYNIFDQAPEDELLPLCRSLNVGVIARVPFDEGSLTGTLTLDSHWPEGDFRAGYFNAKSLPVSVQRAEAVTADLPAGMNLPEAALRFILSHPDVSTIIPGMRKHRHVEANLAASDRGGLDADLLQKLRPHRWDRAPGWQNAL